MALSSSTSSSGDGEVVCLQQAPVTVHATADAHDIVPGPPSVRASRRRGSTDSTDRFVILFILYSVAVVAVIFCKLKRNRKCDGDSVTYTTCAVLSKFAKCRLLN